MTTHAGHSALAVISFRIVAAEDERMISVTFLEFYKNSAVGPKLQTDKGFFCRFGPLGV
jgi:hypothetical protein